MTATAVDYVATVPCAVWVNILSSCSEYCQLVFLLSLVGRHRQVACDIAKQLWPALAGTWAAQYTLRHTVTSKLAWPWRGSSTKYHLDLTSAQAVEIARMHLLEVQLGVLHDRPDPRWVSKFTVHVSSHSSEPVSPIIFSTCLLQVSKALWARCSIRGAQVQCRFVLWSFGDWHALVMMVGYVTVVDVTTCCVDSNCSC